MAALVPSVVIAYAVYAFFLTCVELFADPAVESALIRGPDLLAQVLYTPLLAAWSIWIGIAISARASDLRVAQQLGMLASLPTAVVAALIAFGAIHATLGLAVALLVLDGLGGGSRRPPSTANGSSPGPGDEAVTAGSGGFGRWQRGRDLDAGVSHHKQPFLRNGATDRRTDCPGFVRSRITDNEWLQHLGRCGGRPLSGRHQTIGHMADVSCRHPRHDASGNHGRRGPQRQRRQPTTKEMS